MLRYRVLGYRGGGRRGVAGLGDHTFLGGQVPGHRPGPYTYIYIYIYHYISIVLFKDIYGIIFYVYVYLHL